MKDVSKGPFFYGWYIAGVCLISLFIAHGVGTSNYGLFIKPFIKDFGWSRAAVSGAHFILGIVFGLASPLVGRLIDCFGSRKVMIPGAFLFSVAIMLNSLVNSLWHLYLFYGLVGLGIAAIGAIPVNTSLSYWFHKKRGLAIGIAWVGAGLGIALLVPVTQKFISTLGWRGTYLALGLISLVICTTVVGFLMRNRPEDLGLLPDGEETGEVMPSIGEEGLKAFKAVRTIYFWLLGIAFFLNGLGFVSILIHLVPFATDIGITPIKASFVLSFVGIMSIFGRIGYGYLSDKFNKRSVTIVAYLSLSGTIYLLTMVKSLTFLYPLALIFGMSFGGTMVLMAVVAGECFGLTAFGEIYGYLNIFLTLGTSLGPLFTGYIFDITNSYQWAFTIISIAYLLGSLALFFTQPLAYRK